MSRDELDLIIEAVTECRNDWEYDLSEEDRDDLSARETKKVEEGLRIDIELMDETIDLLKNLLVTS